MKCPDCQKELEQISFRGIQIEECLHCKGRWFDREGLKKAKDNTDEDLRWLDFDPFGREAGQFKVVSEGSMCPKCSVKMSSLTYENSKVTIDRCGNCQGIWLHHGEFKKIIEYLEHLIATESASEYVVDSFKKFLEIVTGPEDTVSEAKDFLAVLKLLKLRFTVEHPGMAEMSDKIYQYLPFL